jgi:hypothetical protein
VHEPFTDAVATGLPNIQKASSKIKRNDDGGGILKPQSFDSSQEKVSHSTDLRLVVVGEGARAFVDGRRTW